MKRLGGLSKWVVPIAAFCSLGADHPPAPAAHSRFTYDEGDDGESGTVYDTATKRTWQRFAPTAPMTWPAARTYCARLDGGDGWRLPTLNEALSLIDFTRETPALDSTAFPGAPAGNYYWTSTFHWVYDQEGNGTQYYFAAGPGVSLGQSFHVRCVR